jgi:hypothetical protein
MTTSINTLAEIISKSMNKKRIYVAGNLNPSIQRKIQTFFKALRPEKDK